MPIEYVKVTYSVTSKERTGHGAVKSDNRYVIGNGVPVGKLHQLTSTYRLSREG